jgi:two-component system, NtrC family, sensor kinase
VLILGYYLIDKENREAQEQITKFEKALFSEKKELIKSEVRRIKEYLALEQKSTELTLKSHTKEQTENAYKIASSIYEKNKDIKNEAEIKEEIKTALRGISFFDGRGYIFIIKASDGKWDMLPSDSSKEGKSALGNKDDKGDDIFAKIRTSALKDRNGSFVKYRWYIPGNTKMGDKISFVRYFAPYNWIIGSGEYLQTVEDSLKKKAAVNVSQMRFGADGYSSIYQNDGKIVNIPTAAYLTDESVHTTTDSFGQKTKDIVTTLIKQAEQGGGFYRYDWIKPSTKLISPKIAYAEEFKEWGWVIASGVYMDDIQKEIEARKKNIREKYNEKLTALMYIFAIAILFSTGALLALSISFSKILKYYKIKLEQRNTELEELNATLEVKIAQEVEKSKEKQFLLIKQSRLAAMGEMIGNIAHQWRQPLNALGIIIQDFKMAKDYGELDDKYLEEGVVKAKSLIGHMSKTIDDFRNFFSPDKKKEEFSVAKKIGDTVGFVAASFASNNIDIIEEIEDDSIVVGYPNEFVQVMLNIISNSKDAIVAHKIQNGFVKIRTTRVNTRPVIEIIDNGGGIDKQIIDKIFDPYFTTKAKGHGTGIGLYMSKVIIEDNMGGEIKVTSTDGQTKTTVTL